MRARDGVVAFNVAVLAQATEANVPRGVESQHGPLAAARPTAFDAAARRALACSPVAR